MFSHVILTSKAEYAIRQILRCYGIVTASKSFNTAANIDCYVSSATITKQNFNLRSDLIGPDIVLLCIHFLNA
jgi:hypothetical protein